jgi:hypothetical protein
MLDWLADVTVVPKKPANPEPPIVHEAASTFPPPARNVVNADEDDAKTKVFCSPKIAN